MRGRDRPHWSSPELRRCGLGQTSPNPILSTLQNFRSEYLSRLRPDETGLLPTFDLSKAVGESERITGRKSVHAHG